jgi:hypothetical protein
MVILNSYNFSLLNMLLYIFDISIVTILNQAVKF